MRLFLFGRKPPRQDAPLPEGDHGPASKALAAILMAADMLAEAGFSQTDEDRFHETLGGSLARFHQTTGHSSLATNTLGAALEIYYSPIAAEAFVEACGRLSGPAMLPVFEVYDAAYGRRGMQLGLNPFFGPAALLWDAVVNGVPLDTEAVRLATKPLADRTVR